MISHPFEPIWDAHSRILVLGTFPSEVSRQAGFYYSHPRNRFWRMLELIYGSTVPEEASQKKSFLLERQIALWDVLKSCEIIGSADSSIKNEKPNDIAMLLAQSNIQLVLLNGSKAHILYKRFNEPAVTSLCLPSTSPANAAWSLERLAEAWGDALIG